MQQTPTVVPQQHATPFTGQRWPNKGMLYMMPPTITLHAVSRLKMGRRMLRRGTTITQRIFEDILSSLIPQHFVEMQHVLNVTYIFSGISILK